jgi:hypothetical protein
VRFCIVVLKYDVSLHWVLVVKCTSLFLDCLNLMSSINGQKINQYGSLGIQEDSNVTDRGDCSGLLLWRRDVMPLFPVELHAAGTCAYILITYDEVT